MASKSSLIRTTLTTTCVLISQLSLALSLPTGDFTQGALKTTTTQKIPQTQHEKRESAIPSSAAGLVAGGAVALVFIALCIGLGAASIALFGSLEWGEFRDKKKEGEEIENEKGGFVSNKIGDGDSINEKKTQGGRRLWPWSNIKMRS